MLSLAKRSRRQPDDRRGAVAVEFAVIAPVLVTIMLGMIELNRVFDAQNLLTSAVREGARMASMDRERISQQGQTMNDLVTSTVKTFLGANGFAPDDVDVSIHFPDDPATDFDLDDPANELELFEVSVKVDYSDVSFMPVDSGADAPMTGAIVFRNGRALLSN
ncbi:TadE-like protein [Pseudobythopirellula maris]|uniref:TadE-like protein n=1 Tax=Pseudobythopirellula maris TaxID=2527991 RepID=A0A5C5ZMT4_9BACT|nr:TadE/TadG family type IV pilus assembly protein [Pseudobythopirellula maris]TWT88171.1 TadE-like protein [Pseudobythopirellula maris]